MLLPHAAYADGGVGNVDCQQDPSAAECTVDVGTPGDPGNGGNGSSDDGFDSGAAAGGNCYYERVVPQAPPPAGATDGAWYVEICTIGNGNGSSRSEPMWTSMVPAADPAQVALTARARLQLPAPAIRTNPDASKTTVLTYVPVWLWVDRSSWSARSATASVPGLSVTATATPTKVLWRLGDGTSVVCGQGTAWTTGADPQRPSPTCGHIYDVPATRTLTVTVTWTVAWAGGGRSGMVPDLTTTAQTTVTVTEAPAVNTGRRRPR